MKKGKGKSKKNIKKSNKSLSKEVKDKKGVSNSNKSNKPVKATKKPSKSKLSLKQKAKNILSKETWRDTKDTQGKLKRGRKKSIKLITQGDANRYQQIVKAISDYYKKAKTPLNRKDLYKEYRRVRDEYSNTPLSILIPQFDRIVIQKKGTRQFPQSLALGIPWYQFEDEMTAPYVQNYFRKKDNVVLELGVVKPSISNMRFPYVDIIGKYKKLYNNINFRQTAKKTSPPIEFVYSQSKSNVKKGIYVFVLDIPAQNVPQAPKLINKVIGIPIDETTSKTSINDTLEKRVLELDKQKTIFAEAFKNKDMTYQQYRMEVDDINEAKDELENKIKKNNKK